MQVTLYRFNGKKDEANKLQGNITQLFNANVTPYGAFSATNVVFVLDYMYSANYCKYIYNNKTYYGFCTVSVASNGLYEYHVEIDALTTAWYAGCFETSLRVSRSPYSNWNTPISQTYISEDPLVTISNIKNVLYANCSGWTDMRYRVLIQVAWGGNVPGGAAGQFTPRNEFTTDQQDYHTYTAEIDTDFDPVSIDSINKHLKYPTSVLTYALTIPQFKYFTQFIGQMPAWSQKLIAGGVLRIALVNDMTINKDGGGIRAARMALIRTSSQTTNYAPAITIYAPNREDGDQSGDKEPYVVVPIGSWSNSPPEAATGQYSNYYQHYGDPLASIPMVFRINGAHDGWEWDTPTMKKFYNFHLPNGVTINIKGSSIPAQFQDCYLAVLTNFDPGSFQVMYRIAGSYKSSGTIVTAKLDEYTVITSISATGCLPYDSSVTNWTSMISSAGNIVLQTAAGGITGGWAGALAGLASSGLQAISNYANLQWQEETGGFSIVGNAGGDMVYGSSIAPFCEIVYYEVNRNDYDDITATYGYICDHPIGSSTYMALRGPYQLKDPKLLSMGYEKQIIEEAQAAASEIFYKN